jgi:hypothetical protein
MQLDAPLTLALSPSDGERGLVFWSVQESLFGEEDQPWLRFSFSPSEGEKAGKRGPFDCIVTAKSVF